MTRPLGALLHGAELATMSELEVAWQVLVVLLDRTTVTVVAQVPS